MANNLKNSGKVQPQAIELEEVVLGGLLLEREALTHVSDILTPEMFYTDQNMKVYEAIQQLHFQSKAVDIITVTHQLRQNGNLEIVGGGYYVTSLTNRVTSAANIEHHARIIQETALRREMIRICSETITAAFDDSEDVFDTYQNISENLFKRFSINTSKQAKRFIEILKERLKTYGTPVVDGLTGVPTGFRSIDKITGGWQNTDLVIIAGRPGMGKTAFVLNTLRKAAVQHGKPTAIFSLEMSDIQLVDRLVAAETEINQEKLKKGLVTDLEWQKIHSAKELMESQIYIDDTPALNIFEFRAKARRLKMMYDIQLIVVDYLQLMHGNSDNNRNREQEIGSISRALKSVAKELNVPVIALSQLSRNLESRAGINGKRPILSDLRESGSIEQDADMVWFLYRPEYYNITEDEKGNAFPPGATEAICAKNRHGPLDTALIKFHGGFMKFSEFEDEYPVGVPFKEITLTPSNDFDDIEETPF